MEITAKALLSLDAKLWCCELYKWGCARRFRRSIAAAAIFGSVVGMYVAYGLTSNNTLDRFNDVCADKAAKDDDTEAESFVIISAANGSSYATGGLSKLLLAGAFVL